MSVLILFTEVLSVRNPLDSIGVVCSLPIDICNVASVDVDAEFGCVLVVIPVIVSLIELSVVFWLTPVISELDTLDTIGVVCSSTVNISDVDSLDANVEFCSALVVISVLVSLTEVGVVF
jgi:hypothetical protein